MMVIRGLEGKTGFRDYCVYGWGVLCGGGNAFERDAGPRGLNFSH